MKVRKTGFSVIALGLVCILCSGLIVWNNTMESAQAESTGRAAAQAFEEDVKANPLAKQLSVPEFIPDYKLNPRMEMPTVEIDGDKYVGRLSVPSLGLDLGVLEKWSYAGLKKSLCRYAGTPYTGTFVVCAHNYKSHFGNVKNLKAGDAVSFQDADGNVFEYAVAEVRDIKPYPDTQATESGYDLVMTTCTLGGRSRWAVFCNLVEDGDEA